MEVRRLTQRLLFSLSSIIVRSALASMAALTALTSLAPSVVMIELPLISWAEISRAKTKPKEAEKPVDCSLLSEEKKNLVSSIKDKEQRLSQLNQQVTSTKQAIDALGQKNCANPNGPECNQAQFAMMRNQLVSQEGQMEQYRGDVTNLQTQLLAKMPDFQKCESSPARDNSFFQRKRKAKTKD